MSVCRAVYRWMSSVFFLWRYFIISLEWTLCCDFLACWRSGCVLASCDVHAAVVLKIISWHSCFSLSVHGFLWVQRQDGSRDEESVHLQVRKVSWLLSSHANEKCLNHSLYIKMTLINTTCDGRKQDYEEQGSNIWSCYPLFQDLHPFFSKLPT